MKLSVRFNEALGYAAALHADQVRKGSGTPYVAHLLAVASLTLEHGGDEDQAIAALLHDAVEDQGGLERLNVIRDKYGEAVAIIVEGCTDAVSVPKPPWRERKERYIEHLADVEPRVRLVSLCDKLHNARSILTDYHSIGEEIWSRFRGGRQGSLWYYRALLETFARYPEHDALKNEFRRCVEALEALANSGDEAPSA